MIKRILCLTKILFKSTLSSSFSKSTSVSKKKNSKRIGAKIGLAVLFIYISGVMLFLTYEVMNTLIPLKQETAFIGIIVTVNIILSLFLTLLSSANQLYFAKDTVSILPLPFSSYEIVSAKINHLFLTELISEVWLGIIPLCMYGYMTKAGVLFYILMIVVMLFVPIIPILLSSLIVMVLMAFTKTFKNKSLIQTITIVFSMFFGFGVSMIMNSINPTDQNEVLALLLKAGSLVQTFYKIFPTIILGVTTLTDLNVLPLLLLIISSAAIYVLVVIFARPLYFKGVIGSMYSGIKSNKKVKTNDFKKANIGVSYVLKEFRCLIRKPIFFTQCVLPYFLIPVLIIVSTIVGFNGSDSGLKFNQIGFVLNQVPGVERYVFIVAELILMFLSFFAFAGATNITRDGHNAIFMKYIPLSFSEQLFYKAIPGYLMTIFPEIILINVLGVILDINLVPIIMASILFLFVAMIQALIGVIYDALKPKLNWTNEYQAVKNNMNMIIIPIISTMLAIPFVLVLIYGNDLNYSLIVLASFVFYIFIDAILITLILVKDEKLARNIY